MHLTTPKHAARARAACSFRTAMRGSTQHPRSFPTVHRPALLRPPLRALQHASVPTVSEGTPPRPAPAEAKGSHSGRNRGQHGVTSTTAQQP
eukprot:50091-Chlamydomonas_euryale.AAC.1